MRLFEISIIQSLQTQPDEIKQLILQHGSFQAAFDGKDIYCAKFPDHSQEAYYIIIDDKMASYCILENKNGHWWALEGATEPEFRGKGLNRTLWYYVVKYLKRKIFMDLEMTRQAARISELLIKSKEFSVSIAYLETGTLIDYNPDTDSDLPMYDQEIQGIPRTIINSDKAKTRTWVLENRSPRRGLLSGYVRKL